MKEKSNSCLLWLSSPSCLLHQKVPQPYPNYKLFYCNPLKGGGNDSFTRMGIFLCIYQLYVPFIVHIILVESLSSERLLYEAKCDVRKVLETWVTKVTSNMTDTMLNVFHRLLIWGLISEAVIKLSLLAWITLAQLPWCRADDQVNYLGPMLQQAKGQGVSIEVNWQWVQLLISKILKEFRGNIIMRF